MLQEASGIADEKVFVAVTMFQAWPRVVCSLSVEKAFGGVSPGGARCT